ncbi:unnamed protein product [Ectocarpus sp. 12 AP-2014]
MGVPILKVLLAGVDVSVLLLVVTLLVSNCKAKQHESRIWATAFHLLAMVWLTLRGMFWVFAITTREEWESTMFGLLYWLPNPLQFGCFLLLPMAYSKVLSSEKDWKAKSRVVGRVYVTLVSGMLVYMVGYALVQVVRESRQFQCVTADQDSKDAPQTCYSMDTTSDAFRVLTGFCFFALAAGVASYGFKMSRLTASQNRAQLIYHPRALTALNCFLVAVFLSKGAYQISSVKGLWCLPDIPLKGSEDVCLLNFCVFMLWDYLPTVWLLLVMEGTTGEHVGTSVVKAVHPANYGDDLRNLPDYGVFREIKAAAARDAARAERAWSGASTGQCVSYSSWLSTEQSPRTSGLRDPNHFKNVPAAPYNAQGGGGSYPSSVHSSRENLSQSGGGGGGGGSSSNGYGFYGYGSWSAATAGQVSSVGSSLGGMAFVASPSSCSLESHDRQNRRGPFSWLLGWRRSATAEAEAGSGAARGVSDGRARGHHRSGSGSRGGGGGGSPFLWQASMDCGSSSSYNQGSSSSYNHGSSSSHNKGSSSSSQRENANETSKASDGGGMGATVSRWWRRVLEGKREGSAPEQAGETASLWQSSVADAPDNWYPGFGELSRAEVTYSLRGYRGPATRQERAISDDSSLGGGGGAGGMGGVWEGYRSETGPVRQTRRREEASVETAEHEGRQILAPPRREAVVRQDYGSSGGDGGLGKPARINNRPGQTVDVGDGTFLEGRGGHDLRYPGQGEHGRSHRGGEELENWQGGTVRTEVARGGAQVVGGGRAGGERTGEGIYRPYHVPG